MALLEVRDLHTFYGHIEALKGISIEVGEGEVVALLGSNGAGKTTTLRTISGLERARSGSIMLDGRDITNHSADDIVSRGFAQVPEGRRIFSALTVHENLKLGGYLYRRQQDLVEQRRQYVYEVFPRLAERRSQLAGTLSGGEQQMLAIGRALMTEPRVLGLDEPSLGLAPILVQTIFDVLAQIHRRGVAILLVEQYARKALKLADRAYVLENGEIVIHGPAREIAEDPRIRAAYLGGDVLGVP